MSYPEVPKELKKKGVGVSLTTETIRLADALSRGVGKRSEFLGEMVVIGLEHRYGLNWKAIAAAIAEADEPIESRAA